MELVHWRKLSCGKSGWYTVSSVARMARTSSEVWLAMRQKGASLSKRRRNCNQVGSGKSNVSFKGIVSPRPAATRHNPSGCSYESRPWSVTCLSNIRCGTREIVCIIDNQAFSPVLVQVSHEFGLAGAPMPSQRETQSRKKLVAQCLL